MVAAAAFFVGAVWLLAAPLSAAVGSGDGGASPCAGPDDGWAAVRFFSPAARLEETLAGDEAEELVAAYNRAPPRSEFTVDRIDVYGIAGGLGVVVLTFRNRCFVPITRSRRPVQIPRSTWQAWKALPSTKAAGAGI
jgi:hypothetical protein